MTPSVPGGPPTRRGLLAGGAAVLGSLTGCASLLDGDRTAASTGTDAGTATATPSTAAPSPSATATPDLVVRASSVVYPVVADLAALWNANPAPAGSDRWTPAAYGIAGAPRPADHFARRNGLDPTAGANGPPFRVSVELTYGEEAARAVAVDGHPHGDVAGVAEPSLRELPDAVAGQLSGPVLLRAGHAFVASAAVAEAGATRLEAAALRAVYAGAVTNWRALGGPDRAVFALARPAGEGSATPLETFFAAGEREFALGGLDRRTGPTELLGVVARRDDAVALVRVGDAASARRRSLVTTGDRSVDADAVATPDLVADGEPVDLHDPAYPTTFDARFVTRGAPDARERAFLDALASRFGRREVVGRDPSLASVEG